MPSFEEARALLLRHRDDPDGARRLFRWPDAPQFNWAVEHFDRIARGNDSPALRVLGPAGERVLSFAAMSHRSMQLAAHLRGLGVRRGDRMLLLLGNVPALWEATLAAIRLGAVVIPAATQLGPEDLRDRIARGHARHVIAEAALVPRLEGLADGLTRLVAEGEAPGWLPLEAAYAEGASAEPGGGSRAGDPLLLYFTSGTTARPKLVLHTHASYPAGHLSTMYWLGLRPGDVHLNLASPGWAKHAWSSLFAPWNAGATILALNQARFDANGLLDVLEREGVTTFCAPPTVWRMLVQEDLAARRVTLREACAAGEPLNPEVIEQVRAAWGLTVRDGYGQTETTLQVGNPPGVVPVPGAMGRPMPGYEVRLLDVDGKEAEEGELCLPLDPPPLGLMAGYEGEDGALRPVGDGRVYRTGDVARREADGTLVYVGRADDMFKSSGYRISPFEIESALVEHPLVAEAAVVPVPDPTRGLLPKAFVVLAAGARPDAATAAALFTHLRGCLAPYKRVRRIEFSELPKTISGKIRRVELRARQAGEEFREE